MEGMRPHNARIENLLGQARKLTSDMVCLANLCAQEASHLNRLDNVTRLKTLCSSIGQQLKQVMDAEREASYRHTTAKLRTSIVSLAVGLGIRKVSENKRALAVSNHLLNNVGGKELPFGTVVVSIGPKGCPKTCKLSLYRN